jgi:hypothetical protein
MSTLEEVKLQQLSLMVAILISGQVMATLEVTFTFSVASLKELMRLVALSL